jgi:hypothetical protein
MNCNDRPLLRHYDGEYFNQPAYLYIDSDNTFYCDYTGCVGGGAPSDVHNGLTLRFAIDEKLVQSEIDELLEKVKPLVEKLIANSEIDYNNCNRTRVINEVGMDVYHDIERLCELHISQDFDQCGDEECGFCYNNL